MTKTLKTWAARALDSVLLPLCSYFARRLPATTVLRELERRTAQECADYVESRMSASLQFERKADLLDYAIGKAPQTGMAAEFGVWKGQSINHIAKRLSPDIVYGFDSFEGLREDWSGWSEPKGTFSLGGKLPKVRSNVRLVKGWFDQTLPSFLQANALPFAIVHLDSDTYEAAKTVLELISSRITEGTVIIFDEYFGYLGWRGGEFKAWQELVAATGFRYEYLAFSTQAVSVRVIKK